MSIVASPIQLCDFARRRSGSFIALLAGIGVLAYPEVLRGDERPEYPEGSAIPRSLTAREKAFLRFHPLEVPRFTPGAATGPVRCPAEYEPMEALLISWEGDSSWIAILKEMALQVTTIGDADLYVMVDSSSEQSSASASLGAAGVDLERVHFCVVTTDTIWIRDYGPRYIYQGDCRAIVDHVYNRPRPWDDKQPAFFAGYKNHAIYDLPLIHGGGNFHLNALGDSHVTRLVNNENPDLTELEIHDLWSDFQNVDTTFHDPLPISVDSTQHIDMWLQVIADDAVMVSDWPFNVGSTQDVLCDAAAVWFADQGYSVHRVPARKVGGIHYTYTNVVMCNDLVMVPTYTNGTVEPHNAEALAVWESALPDKAIVSINSQSIIGSAGALHCIVMHLPKALGEGGPTVYLKNLRGGEVLTAGQIIDVLWISDDDIGVESVDIELSIDGGENFPFTMAQGTEDDGVMTWTVPNISTPSARIRLHVYDAGANLGSDQSDADFQIVGAPGDYDLNGSVNLWDYSAWLDCWTGPQGLPYPIDCGAFDDDLDLDVDLVDFAGFQRTFR